MPDPRYAKFDNRWRITGRLVTQGPLHIGSGLTERFLLGSDLAVEINTIARAGPRSAGSVGWPLLPASTLKGALRARLEQSFGTSVVAILLGGASDDEKAEGGKAGFWDSHVPDSFSAPVGWEELPFFNRARLTALESSVAIDRRTRAASEHKLMHAEYVPGGCNFEVSVTGQNLTESEVAMLLWALRQFNASFPLALGSQTGNGWGALRWADERVECFTRQDLPAWMAEPEPPVAFTVVRALTKAERTRLEEALAALKPRAQADRIVIHLRLEFEGPFAVRRTVLDLSRDDKAKRKPGESDTQPRLINGRALLPARSIRGVLRSRAERILRTLAGDDAAPDPTRRVESGRGRELSLAGQMFGAANWRSPIECSDFVSENPAVLMKQEFVAIDRYTGAVEGGKKFDMVQTWQPVLRGTLSLSLTHWRLVESWATGLLALVLRDLAEGDLTFGMGASKGLGVARGIVEHVILADGSIITPECLTPEYRQALEEHVTAFRSSLSTPA